MIRAERGLSAISGESPGRGWTELDFRGQSRSICESVTRYSFISSNRPSRAMLGVPHTCAALLGQGLDVVPGDQSRSICDITSLPSR